jgi:hypothetical protein
LLAASQCHGDPVRARSEWQRLRAVKGGCVYAVDGGRYFSSSAKIISVALGTRDTIRDGATGNATSRPTIGKIIEVNITYRDPRLSRELGYLVIHEAAHFIWRDHSPAFRAFLRSVGVPQDYILHRGEASPMYRLVQAEQAQRQLRLFG